MHGGEKSELNVVMNYPGRVSFWHKMIDCLNTTYFLKYSILQEIAKILFIIPKKFVSFQQMKKGCIFSVTFYIQFSAVLLSIEVVRNIMFTIIAFFMIYL